jgi:hypothetical protein
LNRQVPERNHGDVPFEANPTLATVEGAVEAELGADKVEVGFEVVLFEAPKDLAIGKVPGDGVPSAAAVFTADEIGLEIAGFVVIEDGVDDIDIVEIGFDIINEGFLRHAVDAVDASPGFAAVLGYLKEAIVRADIDETFLQRGF